MCSPEEKPPVLSYKRYSWLKCMGFKLLRVFLILHFVCVVYHVYLFADIEPTCLPGVNPIWSWCMIILRHCGIQFANILLRIFAAHLKLLSYWIPTIIDKFLKINKILRVFLVFFIAKAALFLRETMHFLQNKALTSRKCNTQALRVR